MPRRKSKVKNPKRTISRDSVFRDVGAGAVPGIRDDLKVPAQGLPQDETKTYQTAVWLGDEEIEWLDGQCRTVQRGGWRGITRSALIRALIKAASGRRVDLTGVSGEVEIAERLTSKLASTRSAK
jgi:hypothetical protein